MRAEDARVRADRVGTPVPRLRILLRHLHGGLRPGERLDGPVIAVHTRAIGEQQQRLVGDERALHDLLRAREDAVGVVVAVLAADRQRELVQDGAGAGAVRPEDALVDLGLTEAEKAGGPGKEEDAHAR